MRYPDFPRLRRSALEFLQQFSTRVQVDGHRALLDGAVGALADQEMRSFLLPENGAIIDEGTKSRLTLQSCRMPFTKCALEYSIADDHYRDAPSDRWRPSATILLVRQHEDGGQISAHCIWREDMPDGRAQWHASPRGFGLTEQSSIEVVDRRTVLLDKLAISYIHDDLKPTEAEVAQAVQDFSHEAAVLAHFVLLCNCDNVSPTKIFEPSAKLRKRAEERGNLLPDEYYVLDCFLGEHQERQPRGDGEHASPRFHVRRGHIRRLQTGALTWVKQCTVGDIANGKIDKDYRPMIRPEASA